MLREKAIAYLVLFISGTAICFGGEETRIHTSKEEIYLLIGAGRYQEAASATDKLITNFSGRPELPDVLYWIAERYERASRFGEAERISRQIAQDYPGSPYARKAKLGLSRAEAMSLIASQDYELAGEAIEKMVVNFAGNPDLPETLYWITERYERASRFEEAKRNYQRIADSYPASPYGSKARLGVARSEAMSLIISKDYEGARKTIDKLVTDFGGRADLPGTLYWITERYARVGRFDEAKRVCQQIIRDYPGSPYADRAKLRVLIADVMALMDSEDYNGAEAALDKIAADNKDHQSLPMAVLVIGERCYRGRKTADSAERAKKVFRIITEKLPASPVTPEACCWAGDCCTELGQYEEAIEYYKRSCDGFPQYGCSPEGDSDGVFRQRSLYMTGQSYQKLSEQGGISKEKADPLIIESYERLLRDFGNGEMAKDARRELGHVYARNERWAETVSCFEVYLKQIPEERCPPDVQYELARAYDETGDLDSARRGYKKFLGFVMPNDQRRKEVRARLAVMEKAD